MPNWMVFRHFLLPATLRIQRHRRPKATSPQSDLHSIAIRFQAHCDTFPHLLRYVPSFVAIRTEGLFHGVEQRFKYVVATPVDGRKWSLHPDKKREKRIVFARFYVVVLLK